MTVRFSVIFSALFSVTNGGQGGAIQESCGVFLSCIQTTLAQHGTLAFHL